MPEGYWAAGGTQEDDNSSDLPCACKCGQASFAFHTPPFAAPLAAAALRERGRFLRGTADAANATGTTSLWDEALTYVAARPEDHARTKRFIA